MPRTTIRRKMSAVDCLHRQLEQAFHTGNIVFHLEWIVTFDERANINDVTRNQQARCFFPQGNPSGAVARGIDDFSCASEGPTSLSTSLTNRAQAARGFIIAAHMVKMRLTGHSIERPTCHQRPPLAQQRPAPMPPARGRPDHPAPDHPAPDPIDFPALIPHIPLSTDRARRVSGPRIMALIGVQLSQRFPSHAGGHTL